MSTVSNRPRLSRVDGWSGLTRKEPVPRAPGSPSCAGSYIRSRNLRTLSLQGCHDLADAVAAAVRDFGHSELLGAVEEGGQGRRERTPRPVLGLERDAHPLPVRRAQ